MSKIEAEAPANFEQEVADAQRYFDSARFEGITRLYTARQVVEQRGTIPVDYTVAREASTAFYARLRELFGQHKSITTFGPYSPGQAVSDVKLMRSSLWACCTPAVLRFSRIICGKDCLAA